MYLIVPGAVNVLVNVCAGLSVPESNVAPDCAVTVWDKVPVTVQTTGVPMETVRVGGTNLRPPVAETSIAVVVAEGLAVVDDGGDWSAPPLSLPPHATPVIASITMPRTAPGILWVKSLVIRR